MAEFAFDCIDVAPERFGVSPTLNFRLRAAELNGAVIHTVALRCQIRIEPRKRRYSGEEPELLKALFGEQERWGETLKPIHFANVSVVVPSFTGSTEVTLAVPCSYDMDAAPNSYFHALRDGDVPFALMFSGTVFGKGEHGFWVEQIPWHHTAEIGMPITVWQDTMQIYFPGVSYLKLARDTVDSLQKYKADQALPTWDAVMASLLDSATSATSSSEASR
jgi:hypothetical protein